MKRYCAIQDTSLHIKRFFMQICICSFLFLFTTAFAQNPVFPISTNTTGMDKIVKAVNDFRADLVPKVQALTVTQLNDLFKNAVDSFTASAQQANLATQNPENVGGKKPSVYQYVEDSVAQGAMEKLTNSLAPVDPNAQRQVLLQPPSNDKNAIARMLDAQNILGATYDATAQNFAERTIAFLSNYADALGTVDLQQLHDKRPDLESSSVGQAYRVKIFTNAAIRSLFLSNLYTSFYARVPVKQLGKISGMTQEDASLSEVTKYIATRRISDPNWYSKINTASPIVVQRETVFILAEIQRQLYQLHLDNERMLQTMTAVGVLNLRAGLVLPDQNETSLKQALDGTTLTAPKPPQ